MKSKLYSLIAVILSVHTLFAHTPHDDILVLQVSPDNSESGIVLAASAYFHGSIWRSTDNGDSFSKAHAGLGNVKVTDLVFDENVAESGVAYISSLWSGLWKSSDKGLSWKNEGVNSGSVLAVTISPDYVSNNLVYYMTQAGNLVEYNDRTKAKKTLKTYPQSLVRSQLRFAGDHLMALAIEGDGIDNHQVEVYKKSFLDVYDTENKSIASKDIASDGKAIVSLRASPNFSQDNLIIVGRNNGDIVSIDQNGTSKTLETLPDDAASDIAFSPEFKDDKTIAICTRNGWTMISNDAGKSWKRSYEGLFRHSVQADGLHARSISFSSNYKNDKTIMLAKFEGIYKTTDDGDYWRHVETYGPRTVKRSLFAPDYAQSNRIFYGTYDGGVLRTDNGGDSWEHMNANLPTSNVNGFIPSSNYKEDRIIFANSLEDLYKTVDGGDTWTKELDLKSMFSFLGRTDMVASRTSWMSPDFKNNGLIYLSGQYGGTAFAALPEWFAIYDSNAKEGKLVPIGKESKYEGVGEIAPQALAFHPDYPETNLMFTSGRGGIARSTDSGRTWKKVGQPGNFYTYKPITMSPEFSKDNTVYVIANGELHKSTDLGDTWSRVRDGVENYSVQQLLYSPDYSNDKTVFMKTFDQGILKSTDKGKTWKESGLKGRYFFGPLRISPNYIEDGTILAPSEIGVYMTADRGETWSNITKYVHYSDRDLNVVFKTADGHVIPNRGFFADNPSAHQNKHRSATDLDLLNTLMYRPETFEYRQVTDLNSQMGKYTEVNGGESDTFVHIDFVGHSIKLYGHTGPRYGIAKISVNGGEPVEVDFYSPTMNYQQELFSIEGLDQVQHELVIEIMGTKNRDSSGTAITIDHFDVGVDVDAIAMSGM